MCPLMHVCAVLLTIGSCLTHMHPLAAADNADPEYLNSFIVKVNKNIDIRSVAEDHGFTIKEKLPHLDIYHLTHSQVARRSKRADTNYVTRMKEDPRVMLVEQQRILQRVKRTHEIVHDKQLEFPLPDIKDNSKFYRAKGLRDNKTPRFNDRYYTDQWYLENTGLTHAREDIDMNVVPAWQMGFTGRGVVVSILDDGIDHNHPDLRDNYDPRASDDLNDESDLKNDPEPDKHDSDNSHGTKCAGEVAGMANNGVCGVGVAYEAKIGGIRILDGPVTDALEAKALLFEKDYIDIKSASWGPHDQGETMEGPSTASKEAMREAVKTGRRGKGTVFVWAAGNGGGYDDNCGADGYVSSVESISVQSMSPQGELPFFGEICTSTMVSVPAGGEKNQAEEIKATYDVKVVTTDLNGGCVENFEGTSSAAPLAAGCLALVLQANPDLTWRDVQHIVAQGARIPGSDEMWMRNGAGYHVNPQYGFGMMDCAKMVQLAQGWVNRPPQHQCETQVYTVNKEIPNSGCHKLDFTFDGCQDDDETSVTHMEHVEVMMKIQPVRRGNIQIFVISPSGTRSEVLRPRKKDDTDEEIDFTFMTVHNWGEDPAGQWGLEVCDSPPAGITQRKQESAGLFKTWQLRVLGYMDHDMKKKGQAQPLNGSDIERVIKKEFQESRSINLKRAQVNSFDRIHADKEEEEIEDVDKLVDSIDSVFATFKNTYGTRSLERYLKDYVEHKSQNQNFPAEKYGNGFAEDKRGFKYATDTDNADSLKYEIVDILRELDRNKMKTGESYLDAYMNRKRELLQEEKIRELIDQISDLLGKN